MFQIIIGPEGADFKTSLFSGDGTRRRLFEAGGRKCARILAVLSIVVCCLAPSALGIASPQAETPHFTFYYTTDSKAVQLLIDSAEAIALRVTGALGLEIGPRITVCIAGSHKEFQAFQPTGRRAPSWAVGTAYAHKNLIVLFERKRVDLLKTFSHEVCHVLLGQAFGPGARVPRWLNEGLAMIIADEWSLSRLSTMTSAALTDSLLPMDEIVKGFPLEHREAEIAYCQSFYFISFLKGRFGAPAFQTFLEKYCQYKNFERAIRSAYHLDWYQVESQWHKYIRLRFSWIPLLTSTGALWFVASLVFLAGYVQKKRKSRKKMAQWEIEEQFMYGPDDQPPPRKPPLH